MFVGFATTNPTLALDHLTGLATNHQDVIGGQRQPGVMPFDNYHEFSQYSTKLTRDFISNVAGWRPDQEQTQAGESFTLPKKPVISDGERQRTRRQDIGCSFSQNGRNGTERVLRLAIPGEDGRKRVKVPTQWPDCVHSKLDLYFNDQPDGGTGVLVGPHLLLTAAHNVFDQEGGARIWAKKVSVYPALNEDQVIEQAEGIGVWIYEQWFKDENPEFDIALIVLNKALGSIFGWRGLYCPNDQTLGVLQDIQKFCITGYPGDKGCKQMWTMAHKLNRWNNEQLFYVIDTACGQSGSGIEIRRQDEEYVIGVHTNGGATENRGTRLSQEKFRTLIFWMQITTEKLAARFAVQPVDNSGLEVAELASQQVSHDRVVGQIRTGDDTVVMGHFPGGIQIGNRSVVIGTTGERENTILNHGGMAVGYQAQAASGSIAIGSGSKVG